MFVGTEMIPLAAEETRDPRKDIPKGMIRGLGVSITVAFLVLFVGASMPPGVDGLSWSATPLAPAMEALFGDVNIGWSIMSLPATAVSMKAAIYAYGRVYYSLGRTGFLPDAFTRVTKDGIPYVAMIMGSLSGCTMCWMLAIDKRDDTGLVHYIVSDMIIITGYIHLVFILAAFITLRVRCPHVSECLLPIHR